jgi:hypothetical protein
MKFQAAVFAALVSALALLFVGCVPGKYVAKENEELYGTWTNDTYFEFQEIVYFANNCNWYQRVGNPAPTIEGSLEITSKWKDAEGNIWYKYVDTNVGGIWGNKGVQHVSLAKLSNDATVLELVYTLPMNEQETKVPVYPTSLDPKRYNYYGLYHRAVK